MKVALIFPSYLHLAGFMSQVENGNIQMDLRKKSLTAFFSEKDIQVAITKFCAQLIPVASE